MSTLEQLLTPAQTAPALRFITCGSVDDGKSTLIGRLLVDTKAGYAFERTVLLENAEVLEPRHLKLASRHRPAPGCCALRERARRAACARQTTAARRARGAPASARRRSAS
mgnify:CR=1 FL=1